MDLQLTIAQWAILAFTLEVDAESLCAVEVLLYGWFTTLQNVVSRLFHTRS